MSKNNIIKLFKINKMTEKVENPNKSENSLLNVSGVINRSSYLDRTWVVNTDGEISSTECDEETIQLINHETQNWTTLPNDISQKIVNILNGL